MFGIFPGGKVMLVGKVGDDVFGKRYREIFDAEGVDHEAVSTQDGEFTHVPGFSVKVQDTTAAGDSFNAGLAFALRSGDGLV